MGSGISKHPERAGEGREQRERRKKNKKVGGKEREEKKKKTLKLKTDTRVLSPKVCGGGGGGTEKAHSGVSSGAVCGHSPGYPIWDLGLLWE